MFFDKFSGLSLLEIETLMDLTSGRVEDMDCDEMEVPETLQTLASELEQEHISRMEVA